MLTLAKLKILYISVLIALFVLGCGSEDEPEPAAIASFTTSTQNIKSGESVTFTSTSQNETELQWIFEGGTPSTSSSDSPVVKYNNAGNFSVTLIASNGSSSDTESKSSHVKVADPTPTASFTASSQAIKPGEGVSFSNNSSNAVRFEWTFEGGDPSSSLSENPTVTYNNQGEFAVTLKAFNASDVAVTESKDNFIVVDDPNPVASFTHGETTIKTGTSVSYTNTSTNAIRFEWTFEGGTPSASTDANPEVTYNSVGRFNTTLKVFNDSDESSTETKNDLVTVMNAPVAAFTQSSLTIKALESITFNNTSSGSGNSYEWTFQGGSPASSTETNPGTIKFETEGTYTITLKATNAVGTSTKTKTVTVNPPTEFTLVMENHLFYEVFIYNNNSYIGTIDARSNKTFNGIPISTTNIIKYQLNPPIVSGTTVGINFAAQWSLNSPRGEIGLEVTNETSSEVLQFIVLDNREAEKIYWNVGGSKPYSSTKLFGPVNAITGLGYSYFEELTHQCYFYRNEARTGTYWQIAYNKNVVDDKSGRVDIKFDINGAWDTGTWGGSISREAPKVLELESKFRADWDIPLQKADFSNTKMITVKATLVK